MIKSIICCCSWLFGKINIIGDLAAENVALRQQLIVINYPAASGRGIHNCIMHFAPQAAGNLTQKRLKRNLKRPALKETRKRDRAPSIATD